MHHQTDGDEGSCSRSGEDPGAAPVLWVGLVEPAADWGRGQLDTVKGEASLDIVL